MANYSAGTAFLDVIPSFDGVQQAIGREVRQIESALGKTAGKEFGENFEDQAVKAVDKALGTTKAAAKKQGKEAAEEYAGQFADRFRETVTRMNREMSRLVERNYKLDVQFDDKQVRERFNNLRREIAGLGKAKIGVDVQAGPAMLQLERIAAELKGFQDKSVSLDVRTNLGAAIAEVEAFRKRIQQDAGMILDVELRAENLGLFERAVRKRLQTALDNFPPIEFDADVTPAQQKLMEIRGQMMALRDMKIGVDLSGEDMLREMEELRVALALLATDKAIDIKVRTDAAAAAAELLAIQAVAKLVDGTEVDIKAKADTDAATSAIGRLRAAMLGVDTDGQEAANGFRAFSARVLAGASILPAVVPALLGMAGALALIGPLAVGAGAGFAVLGIGFTGIGDAVSALGKVQDNAAKDSLAASRTMATASRGVEDAERSLGRAREQAGQASEDAARRVADAVETQQDAEEDLVRAQRDVVRAQEAVNDAREAAQDRIEDLRLAILGGALAEREAILDLADAQREYEAAMADPEATAEDRERLLIDLEQQRLQVERLRLENGRLGEDQAEVNRTGIEGSREVVSAQDRVAQAQEGVSSAMERVADASRGVEDALRAQQQTNASSAQAIGDAQRNLTEAQQAYSDALYDTSVVGSTSMQALELAMANLGPAGQDFARYWYSILPQFRELRDLVQAGMFPGLKEAIDDILTKNGPLLAEFMSAMGTTLGDLFAQFGDMMTSPQWQGIWKTFNEYAPIFMQQFGEMAMAMLTFFGELFQALAPYSERFGEALVGLAEASARWIATFVDSQMFRDIMAWIFESGPVVFEHLWSIAQAFGSLFIALLPLGELILGAIGGIADWINSLDPAVLGALVTAVLGLFIAFQLAAGAIALVSGLYAVLSIGISAWIFAIGAAVTALIVFYTQSETFRDIVDAVFGFIGGVISWWWNNIAYPTFSAFVSLLQWVGGIVVWLWDNVIKPVWDALSAAAVWMWENVLLPIFTAIGDVWNAILTGIQWAWENILKPVWDVIMAVAQVLFAFLVVTVFAGIWLSWTLMSEGFKWAWDNILSPVWEAVKTGAQALWDFLAPIFRTLGEIWEAFMVGMKWIYDEILYPGIIAPFMDALSDIKDAFWTTVDAIKIAWESIKSFMTKPINFVIHFVLNKGLFGAFNSIVDTLGLSSGLKIKPWSQIGDKADQYAAGGRVRGWSPHDKADNIPAMLTANEFVQPVSAVDHYGVNAMELIRKRKIPREVFEYFSEGGFVQHRATGGQIFDLTRRKFPRAKLNSAYRPGDPGYHGRNMAADMGEAGFPGGSGRQYIADMKRWWVDNYGRQSSEIIYNGIGNDRPNVKDGKSFPYSRATQLGHLNHLHVAIGRAIENLGAVGGPLSFGSGSIMDDDGSVPLWRTLWNGATAVFDSIKNSVVGPLTDFASKLGSGPIGKIIAGVPGKAAEALWSKIKDTVAGMFSMEDGDTTAYKGGPVQDIVKGIAARYGWDQGGEWSSLSTLIQKESSWNPNAQNPTSTAYGLFQFLNGTWGKYGTKTSDPAGQTIAGLRYIQDRYGSPSRALAFHRANNWYSEGGPVEAGDGSSPDGAPTLYDTGGWLPPGVTTVLNATNKPEPILTNQQWEDLTTDRAAGDTEQRGIRDLHLHEVQADMSEAVETVNHWVRVYSNGGRYAGTGVTP